VYLSLITVAVDYYYVGGSLLRDVYVVTVGGAYYRGGGVKGAEEGLVIKNRCGAATIHDDESVVTICVQRVVGQ
jgi:hypothetical protein